MGPAGPNAIVSVTGVFVTRTTRDDAYDGMNVAWAGVDLPLGSYFVYDLSLPSIIFPRSDNPSYALTPSRRVLLEGECALLRE